jgi:hypothetical protein
MRPRRTFLLAVVFAGLFAVLLGDGVWTPVRKAAAKALVMAADPLALLDQRSPGKRGEGRLRSTKSNPHERVLPTVRDRLALLGASPVATIDIPPGTFVPLGASPTVTMNIPPGTFGSIAAPLPQDSILPENMTLGALAAQPFIEVPGGIIGGTLPAGSLGVTAPGGGLTPPGSGGSPPLTGGASPPIGSSGGAPPSTGPSGGTSPPIGSGGSSPPIGPAGGSSPPTGPSGGPSPPGIVAISEPGSGAVLIIGLLALGVVSRGLKKRT